MQRAGGLLARHDIRQWQCVSAGTDELLPLPAAALSSGTGRLLAAAAGIVLTTRRPPCRKNLRPIY